MHTTSFFILSRNRQGIVASPISHTVSQIYRVVADVVYVDVTVEDSVEDPLVDGVVLGGGVHISSEQSPPSES